MALWLLPGTRSIPTGLKKCHKPWMGKRLPQPVRAIWLLAFGFVKWAVNLTSSDIIYPAKTDCEGCSLRFNWFYIDVSGCGGKPADILFLLDCSASIWGPNFRKQLQFVRNVVDEFDVTPVRTRIGIMTFGSHVTEEIALGQYVSKQSLSDTINSIHQTRGDTRTDKALDRVSTVYTSQLGFYLILFNQKFIILPLLSISTILCF